MRLLTFLVLGFAMVACNEADKDKTVFMPATARAVFATDPNVPPVDSTIPGSGTTIGTEMPVGTTPEQEVAYEEIWGNSTFFVCRSDVMSTGKKVRAIVEQSPEGLRHFTVNLTLDDNRMQVFDGYQRPEDANQNNRIRISIDETVKASYGLGYDALYEMNFNTSVLTLAVTNGKTLDVANALGIPPAVCSLMTKAAAPY